MATLRRQRHPRLDRVPSSSTAEPINVAASPSVPGASETSKNLRSASSCPRSSLGSGLETTARTRGRASSAITCAIGACTTSTLAAGDSDL